MKPPMRETIEVHVPKIGDDGQVVKDGYGRMETEKVITKGRVTKTNRSIYNQEGSRFDVSLIVELPPDVPVTYGSHVVYIDQFGMRIEGKVLAVRESGNFNRTKIYFRIVEIG